VPGNLDVCGLRAFIHVIERKSRRCHANLRRSDRAGVLQGLARAGPRGRGSGLPARLRRALGPVLLARERADSAGIDCGRSTRSATGSPRATSGFGRASFEFAKDKPLELLSGSNLLYLLKAMPMWTQRSSFLSTGNSPAVTRDHPTGMNLRNPRSLPQAHLAQVTHRSPGRRQSREVSL
jgi:hypothetical protein